MIFHNHHWELTLNWTVGALCLILMIGNVIRFGMNQYKVQQVIHLATPCQSEFITNTVNVLSVRMGVKPPNVLLYHSSKPHAATLFWKRPVILLSSWMLESLDEDEMEAVLAHELAHIKRRDNLLMMIIGYLKDVFFFLPSIQQSWLDFLNEVELAADDLAVQVTEKPGALASALLRVYHRQPAESFAYSLDFAASTHQIEVRVERLLNTDIQQSAHSLHGNLFISCLRKNFLAPLSLLGILVYGLYLLPCCH